MSMQIEFLRDRRRAQVGQKVDATPSTVVSASSNTMVPFGVLVVYDDAETFLCKLPTTKDHLEKPLVITLRQLHCLNYEPKSSMAVLRKGRIWIEAEKVSAPGHPVFIKFIEGDSSRFTGDSKDNTQLKGAIFLEKCEGGLVPMEIDFFGGVV